MRREEETAMAMDPDQVDKDVGMIIRSTNPGPGLMQPPAGHDPNTFKPPKDPQNPPRPELAKEISHMLGLMSTSHYTVEKVKVIDYVNRGENPPKKHHLWIIYGEGGE
jgi:hypothetical protein